jgi:uncharacterized membrane protein
MSKCVRHFALALVLSGINLVSSAQVQPCQPGSLANVQGTSCSVGPLILNFQTVVSGDGAAVGFVPVQSENQAGFRLITSFIDGPNADGISNGAHILQFGYTPQAAPNFVIRATDLSMDATAQGSPQGTAFVQILDFQTYPNSGFLDTDTFVGFGQNVTDGSQLASHVNLEVPALLSNGFTPFTTQLFDFAVGPASASLTSATFLYSLEKPIAAPQPGSFTYTNIDLPGVASTSVSNINNNGQMVGAFQDDLGISHAYLTDPRGGFTTIDFPGAASTSGLGVNNRGDVVGIYTDDTGTFHGFTFAQGNFISIDVPDSLFTFPIGINDKGQIVGEYQSAVDQGFHGFLLENGNFTTIDQGPGTGLFASTDAVGINNQGEIAGDFFDPNTFRGFAGKKSIFQAFDVPGQGDTLPDGINAQGDIVGSYADINLITHGFLRVKDTFSTIAYPGANATFALGINAPGLIVGGYEGPNGAFHSFLAQPSANNGKDTTKGSTLGKPVSKPICGTADWRNGALHSRAALRCQIGH